MSALMKNDAFCLVIGYERSRPNTSMKGQLANLFSLGWAMITIFCSGLPAGYHAVHAYTSLNACETLSTSITRPLQRPSDLTFSVYTPNREAPLKRG